MLKVTRGLALAKFKRTTTWESSAPEQPVRAPMRGAIGIGVFPFRRIEVWIEVDVDVAGIVHSTPRSPKLPDVSSQRTGVQLRAPERAAGERQARLLQRFVGRRHHPPVSLGSRRSSGPKPSGILRTRRLPCPS